jgi:murein L,D-transpeptidase YcbB/YkuD
MRWVYRLALTLAVIAPLHAPAFAAEPEAPAVLIGATEAIRIAIQNRLSAKFTAASNARKSEQGALVEFYSAPEHHLLWVDDKGLTDRGKMVMAEIAKADDYGLRASDYALPKPDTFDASDPKATDWLADAEIKISFAVLGYANDARGGRINPSRLSENLDPSLALPNPSEVIESIAFRSDPAAYLRSFQPDQPQFEALRQKLLELRAATRRAQMINPPSSSRTDLCSRWACSTSKSSCFASASMCPPTHTPKKTHSMLRWSKSWSDSRMPTASFPMAW